MRRAACRHCRRREFACLRPDTLASFGDFLPHVTNHTSYHRVFVADFFYQAPARAPTTDLPVFLRDAPPQLD